MMCKQSVGANGQLCYHQTDNSELTHDATNFRKSAAKQGQEKNSAPHMHIVSLTAHFHPISICT